MTMSNMSGKWHTALLLAVTGTAALSLAACSGGGVTPSGSESNCSGSTFCTITFDSATTPTLTGFGGAEDSMVAAGPPGSNSNVAKVVKSATAESWAGTTVSTGPNYSVGKIPFDAANTRMTVRVWSPDAGIPVRLKVEDAADSTHAVETEATVTIAAGWQTLTFDFASPASGTLNFTYTYNKVSIFFNFGTTGAQAGSAKTYYFDDVAFIGGTGGGGGGGGTGFSTITFEATGIVYTLTGFGGAEDSTVVADPNNNVAKVVKSATAESWAGTTVSTGANLSVGKIPFNAANTRMTVRVWSPDANIPVRLKVEDAAFPNDATHSVETEATVTTAAGWQVLTFDFANPASGQLNFTYTYNKISIFFNFGKTGAQAGSARTYYFDDVTFIGGTGGGGFVNGIFAEGYAGVLPDAAKSSQGGSAGFFLDDRLYATKSYEYGGVASTNFYYGLGLNAPAITDAYFGAFVKSPGNRTVDVSTFTNIKVNVWGPDQLFRAGAFPALDVVLQGPAVANCASASGGSEVQATFNATGQGEGQIYTLPLSSFTVKFACSGESTVAQVLRSIAQVNVVLKGTNIQYVNKDPDGVAFTNGLNVGSIKFD